jgi:hypothetical protein
MDNDNQTNILDDALNDLETKLYNYGAEFKNTAEQTIRIFYPHENVTFSKQSENTKNYQVFIFSQVNSKISHIMMKTSEINPFIVV